ncbi:MAG: c-type cytochrome [Oligoflexus sp.]
MENQLKFKRIIKLALCLWMVCSSGAAFSFGGDKREEKRWYTKQLRSFMWAVDDALSRKLTGQDITQSEESLQDLAKLISGRLVLTHKDDFEAVFLAFMQQLQAKDSKTPTSDVADKDDLYLSFQQLRDAVYRLYRVRTMPSRNPDLQLGQTLYGRHCASCHGSQGRGDGLLTENKNFPMEPRPTNFPELNRLGVRNAYSYFNTMLVGLEHSTMRSFKETLTSHELWSLAFFLLSEKMRAVDEQWKSEASKFEKLNLNLDLRFLATQSDRDFLPWLQEQSIDSPPLVLDWIRNDASFRDAIPRKI